MVDEGAFDKSDGHPTVIAYRLGRLENEVNVMSSRVGLLPSDEKINLMLEPWKNTVRDIVSERKNEIHLKSQLKIAIAAAMVSPIISLFVSIFVLYGVKK